MTSKLLKVLLYNANTETEQCKTFNELQSLLNLFGHQSK